MRRLKGGAKRGRGKWGGRLKEKGEKCEGGVGKRERGGSRYPGMKGVRGGRWGYNKLELGWYPFRL